MIIILTTEVTSDNPRKMFFYLINTCLAAWEREGEAKRQTSVLHPHIVQEIRDTLNYVVKQLEKKKKKLKLNQLKIILLY